MSTLNFILSRVEHEIKFWFKVYFNCNKYKGMKIEITYIEYPGSDKKPKACPDVISWKKSFITIKLCIDRSYLCVQIPQSVLLIDQLALDCLHLRFVDSSISVLLIESHLDGAYLKYYNHHVMPMLFRNNFTLNKCLSTIV